MAGKQKVNESEVLKFGFLGGIAQASYCFFVVVSLMVLQQAMPNLNSIAGSLLFLLIFVFSAAVSAVLVFGYPAYLAFKQRFAEALMTALTTLVTLMIIGILVFILVSLIY
ncbi:MAG: hypothetical protein WC768_03530 [Patescibacteria group bacterium]|jgi:hypothetical protein